MTDIKKLKEIIDEIDVLINKSVQRSDPEFKAWHDKATRFIYITMVRTVLNITAFPRYPIFLVLKQWIVMLRIT